MVSVLRLGGSLSCKCLFSEFFLTEAAVGERVIEIRELTIRVLCNVGWSKRFNIVFILSLVDYGLFCLQINLY